MNFLYNLFFKNSDEQIPINSEAYEANRRSKEILNERISRSNKIMEKNILNLKNEIQVKIDKAINNGKFKCSCSFYSINILEGIKDIKKYYKGKGYKVKIKFDWKDKRCDKKIILSWGK